MTTDTPFKKRIFFLGLLLAGCALASTAWSAPDAPPVPRLGAAPTSAAWTIDYQYKEANPYLKPPDPSQADAYEKLRNQYPRLTEIQVIKSGDRRKETDQFDNQTQSIRWIVGDLLLWENPQRNTLLVYNEKDPTSPRFTHDFDSLSWIDQAAYKGHQTYQQVDCCVYDSQTETGGQQTAYINAQSALPVAVVEGGVTLVYTFTASSQAIQLSPKAAAQLDALTAAAKTKPE